MSYKILEFRDNSQLKEEHVSFYTFDVLTELEGEKKWLSIPYDLYFDWIKENNKNLQSYIENNKFKNLIHIIIDLKELDFDFKKSLLDYISFFYSKSIFKKLPEYDVDNLFDLFLNDFE